ncbi:MAG: gamma-glutamyltransferase [Pseudomonadota bacterium]
MSRPIALFAAAAAFLAPLHVSAQPAPSKAPPIYDRSSAHNPIAAKGGMVVAQEAIAARVGADILRQGGNAVDSAVATGFALAVTLPRAGNLGGGGFMMIHMAQTGKTLALDYREMAPKAATRDMFLDESGAVDKTLARFSHLSAGVPGTVAGLLHAHEAYGSLPLKTLLAPAIDLAEGGFPVSFEMAGALAFGKRSMGRNPAAAEIFYKPDGSNYAAGDVLVQKDLAWSLKQIAKSGWRGFYDGPIAKKLVADMQANGGIISRDDLRGYRVVERAPVTTQFRGYDIAAMPPPSSGGVHIVQMLNMLRDEDFAVLGQGSADALHLMAEAMKYAYADRSKYLGDPDFYPVPVEALTDLAYAKAIRARIKMDRTTPATAIRPADRLPYESPDTTHYSVADKDGNIVSNTYTLNFSYGSGRVATGTGILLNNEMDDFAAKLGVANAFGLLGGIANAIEPGKRPLSSMTPVIVLKDGKAMMATGSPGGSTIITVVLQTLINRLAYDLNIAEATARPRIHHQWLPDRLTVEPHLSADTVHLLEGKGHTIRSGRVLGATETLEIRNDIFYGASDPRRPAALAVGVE